LRPGATHLRFSSFNHQSIITNQQRITNQRSPINNRLIGTKIRP
jgi:hypothetical protein